MTALENEPRVDELTEAENGTTETAEPTVKNPTYRDLAFAAWKLAYRLAFDDNVFCREGTDEYLEYFGLPKLVYVDGNDELKDNYLRTWLAFSNWQVTGDLSEAEDQAARGRLARVIRRYLDLQEPKPRETMSEWLVELGIEPFTPPAPPAPVRHTGRYRVTHNATTEVNSARIVRALQREFPSLDVAVEYDGRVS